MRRPFLAVLVLAALIASACGGAGATDMPLGPVADGDMSLTANNQSDRALEMFVNGGKIADVAPRSAPTFAAAKLPPLPWAVDLRLPTGRVLVSLTVTSGSVVRTASGSQGFGSRVDLSCGRIELYAVLPLGGPAPGAGTPGDCGP